MSAQINAQPISGANSGWLASLARNLLFKRLQQLHTGTLIVIEGAQRHVFGQPLEQHAELQVELVIKDPGSYVDIAFGGSVGAAEAYMTGDWECDKLTQLIQLFVRNMDVLDKMDSGWTVIQKPLMKLLHNLKRNTEKGARRNVAAHYDLGNSMFATFLDPTMMYSSGIFPRADASMQEASEHKLRTICEKLGVQASDHIVEIGTGWGGFAIFAAREYGCRITTTTISQQQYQLAKQRIDEAGLGDKITLLQKDYRKLDGQYDKLVSIEMIEAVGWQYYPTYFNKCASLLKPEGTMLIQAITITDQRFEQYKKDVDFIQKYIFPGAGLPSVSAIMDAVREKTDLRLVHLQDFAEHYAMTLNAWCQRFMQRAESIKAQGYSDEFIRMWEYYLRYCEGGFKERSIGVSHLIFAKPRHKQEVLSRA